MYSLVNTISKGFADNNIETIEIDYESFFSRSVNSFVNRFESLPNKIKNNWKRYYIRKLNAEYTRLFEENKPEIVFIYNNQLILPETLKYFRTKSKVVFFLGDNPLYTPTSEYNLTILYHADYIMCPDTFWISQLERMGVKNLHFGVFGFDETTFYSFKPDENDFSKYRSDLVYIGAGQKTNWGFKRFLFLNNFRNLDLKAYISGDGFFSKWKGYFPGLESKITPIKYFDQNITNLVCNCGKIYPIDLVPSFFHGIHIRIMDSIGSGVMPLVEYSNDIDFVFNDIELPCLKNYDEAENLAKYYLENDSRRERVVENLRDYVSRKYEPRKIVKEILEDVFRVSRSMAMQG